jgi:flagellar assembly protein FliH
LSETARSYDFEQLEPSDPLPRDAPARMLAEAAAEAQLIREHARAEGHAEGLTAGRRDGSAEVSAATLALGQALQEIQSLRSATIEAVERDAIELAIEVAGKILAGTLQARPEQVLELAQGALRRISDRRRITVLVNPADLETVRSAIGEIAAQGSGIEFCEVQSEERVGPGGAIVRTAEGEVDASVATQLERVREVVFTELQTDGRAT